MRKENYFAPEGLAASAAAMAQDLPLNRRAAAFQPRVSALLVIDMQDYFLSPASHAFLPAAPAIVPAIQRLAAAFARAGRPVLFTRHAGDPLDPGPMASWWRDMLTAGHPLDAIHPPLAQHAKTVVDKRQYDAFHDTDLEERLRSAGASQVIVTGVATHLCCESTARTAFVRGFAPFMVIDGTATWNRELHMASLRGLAHGFAVPRLASALIADLPGAS